nr:unnamed protein product [Callosobruchus analis]
MTPLINHTPDAELNQNKLLKKERHNWMLFCSTDTCVFCFAACLANEVEMHQK